MLETERTLYCFYYRFAADKNSKTALARVNIWVRGQKQSFRNFRPSNTFTNLEDVPKKFARLFRSAHLQLFNFERVLVDQMAPFDRGVLWRGRK